MKDELALFRAVGYGRIAVDELSRHVSSLDILQAEKAGFLVRVYDHYVTLTQEGRARYLHLLDLEKQSQQLVAQHAKEKKRANSDRLFQFALQFFFALLSYLLGLFTEAGMQWVENLFH